ncbi:MAG: hypothetical protein SPK00_05235 [Corynebacterium glucuronolyticum]|nr:hypothetical protein [Corynebacterium glucuronolyticum]MDD7586286.1 hypothetical protein [Mycobacteriaceae bacterium]MDY5834136.1 hypothetical protein [Corynebacterium glucuronolyticum]
MIQTTASKTARISTPKDAANGGRDINPGPISEGNSVWEDINIKESSKKNPIKNIGEKALDRATFDAVKTDQQANKSTIIESNVKDYGDEGGNILHNVTIPVGMNDDHLGRYIGVSVASAVALPPLIPVTFGVVEDNPGVSAISDGFGKKMEESNTGIQKA